MWDIRQQPLDGVRADALFGKEPFKQAYKDRLASDAPYDMGMGLFEYICAVENKYNMIDAIDRAKRIMINSCYGKMGEWKYEALPNGGFEMVYKPDNSIYEIKHMDIDEWSKMPPYLAQQQIYITTARGGGRNWYYGRWQKFMEELEKEPKIKPFSRYDDEAVKYMKEDVKMTNQMYEEWIKRMFCPAPTNVKNTLPEIKNVIFNDPATIVIWSDGTKTVVQCQDGDIYDPEKGLAMAISKKILGNKHDYYRTFKHWLKRYKKPKETTEVTCYVDGREFTKAVWTNEEDR
jgi:hypothetical protein